MKICKSVIFGMLICNAMSYSAQAQNQNWEKLAFNMLNPRRDYISDEKPTVFVHFNFNDIHFNVLRKVKCSSSPNAAGCTHYKLTFSINHDCSNNRVDITIMDAEGFPLIELDEQYKESPFWDQILKHEMTHVQISRGNAKKTAPQIASNVVAKYDKLLTQSNSCQYIQSEIYTTVSSRFYEMIEEIKKKQALIDGSANYLYQSMQVWKKSREKN